MCMVVHCVRKMGGGTSGCWPLLWSVNNWLQQQTTVSPLETPAPALPVTRGEENEPSTLLQRLAGGDDSIDQVDKTLPKATIPVKEFFHVPFETFLVSWKANRRIVPQQYQGVKKGTVGSYSREQRLKGTLTTQSKAATIRLHNQSCWRH